MRSMTSAGVPCVLSPPVMKRWHPSVGARHNTWARVRLDAKMLSRLTSVSAARPNGWSEKAKTGWNPYQLLPLVSWDLATFI